jgi:hypothetical protein
MITDKFGLFFDNAAAAASMTSAVINIKKFAGRQDPVNITIMVKGPDTSVANATLNLQQSADNATFTTVTTLVIPNPGLNQVVTIALPRTVAQPYLRMTGAVVKVESSDVITGITVWAGVTEEDYEPYAKGMYIDKGKVIA